MSASFRLPASLRLPALLAAALLAACSPTANDAATAADDTARPAPGAAALPAGWRQVAGDDVPRVARSPQDLPATVLSDDGVEVTVTDTSRTIAGSDDIIMVMESLDLGEQVYAAPTNTVTAVGRAAPHHFLFNRTTGIEGVLSLEGTLFVGNSLRRHGKLAGPLRDAGEAVVIVDELQPAPEKVRKIAAAFGHADEGEQLAMQVQAQLDEAARIAARHTRRPRVIHVSSTGGGGAPTVGGADTAAAEVIRLAGGINVGDEAKVANYSQLSNEGIVAVEPEVILVSEDDLRVFGGEAGLWQAYPSLKQTPAGVANRVWVMPDLQLKMTSVACGTGAVALAEALAELAAELDAQPGA
ncbi:ABC transporter substrate-binding protein [Luteimonas sp. BDR2-5]|uniref:heme/hemin ABC transporter substrate-binding protein n=1 Tax=Proluteimonas luteida TaxID=2878685 RepID=UPI001E4B7BA6|nr:ABC transporter substrate-binding protein [Luteimonas sp. BDR2-5]MCD9028293.1 ABC transporter substrate-binding protein [Luteimonas sp. BDR2-5]